MSKTFRSAVILLFLSVTGYGTDETNLHQNGIFTKSSEFSLDMDITDASVIEVNIYSSIVTEPPHTSRFQPLINTIEQEMKDLKIPGAAVAVVEAGEVTFVCGFGSKHPHLDDPVQPTTLFRIGSVTKTLTAIGLLQLIDKDLVDINAPITDYLPDFSFGYNPNWAQSITIKNLLTHTSAIADYFELDTPKFKDDDALSRFFSGPYQVSPYAYLMAPPGRMFNYTNPGYMLAGWVIESVSGDYYRHYLQHNVLTPLEMKRTFFLPEQVIADGDFAYGSAAQSAGEYLIYEPNSYDNGWARPAGLAFSSVLDLAEIVKFLRAGQPDVLTDELCTAMQEPQMDTEMFLDMLSYGYGLMVQDGGFYHPTAQNFYQMRIISHGGDVPGFSADLYYLPDLDFGFIALTNASYSHLNTSFTKALFTLCEMPAPTSWPDFSMTATDYACYRGQYHDQFGVGDIVVEGNSNRLTVDIPVFEEIGQGYDHTLIPSTRNNFIFYIYDISNFEAFPMQVTFIRDDNGFSEYFRTRSFVGRYTADIPTVRDRGIIFEWREPTPIRPILDVKCYMPEPQLPFIKPPGQR